jgi:hypothetical protein
MSKPDRSTDTPENRKHWIDFTKRSAISYLLSAAKMEGVAHLFDAHIIQFREDGWTIRHPIRERINGTLFECPVNRFDYDGGNVVPGYYWLDESDGRLKAVVDEEDLRKVI